MARYYIQHTELLYRKMQESDDRVIRARGVSCGALPEPRTRPAPAWLRPKPHACWGWVTAAQRGRLRLRRRPAATRGVTTILPLFDPLAFRHANMLIRADSRVVFNDTLENLLDVLRVFVSPSDWETARWFRFPVPS